MASMFAVILDNQVLHDFPDYETAEIYSAQLPGSFIEEYEVPGAKIVHCEFCGNSYWDIHGCTCAGYNS